MHSFFLPHQGYMVQKGVFAWQVAQFFLYMHKNQTNIASFHYINMNQIMSIDKCMILQQFKHLLISQINDR